MENQVRECKKQQHKYGSSIAMGNVLCWIPENVAAVLGFKPVEMGT